MPSIRLPPHTLAQPRHVGRMVWPVPRVERQHLVEALAAGLGVNEHPVEVGWFHSPQDRDPALVDGVEQHERRFDRHRLHIGKQRPEGFLVRLDRRLVLGEGELEPTVRVEVAVGHMYGMISRFTMKPD